MSRRSTGPSREVVEAVLERAGYSCEVRVLAECAASSGGIGDVRGVDWSVHHRHPRGMGGSRRPSLNLPSNLVVACGSGSQGCHGWIESNRTEAYTYGLLVRSGEDPTLIPVRLAVGTVFLGVDGRYLDAPEGADG